MTTPLSAAPRHHDNLGTFRFKRERGVSIKHRFQFSHDSNEIAEFRQGYDGELLISLLKYIHAAFLIRLKAAV